MGYGGGGTPPVNTHRPGTHGANTAGRAGWSNTPSMPQSTAPGGWDSRLVQAAIAEATRSNPSVNAPTTTAPPAGQYLAESAEPVRKKKKAKKRRAADPQPALPPTGKKPKKKGKKLAGAKPQGDEPPSEAQFFAMMRLMADKHGWSIEGQARPTGPDALPSASPTAPLPASHTPAYTDPGMSHFSRAPAALGAPPGEESFPPMGPPPPPRPGARVRGPTVGSL